MKTIWKFPLEHGEDQLVTMPIGAVIRHVGLQKSGVCLWAEVSPDAVTEDRMIFIRGTGHELLNAEGTPYVGSVFDGPFVWHVFDGGAS